jgi:hypothetical protein
MFLCRSTDIGSMRQTGEETERNQQAIIEYLTDEAARLKPREEARHPAASGFLPKLRSALRRCMGRDRNA